MILANEYLFNNYIMQEQRDTHLKKMFCVVKEKMIFEVITYFVEKNRKYSKLNIDLLLRKQFPFLEKEGI